jgi:hypothetical protein
VSIYVPNVGELAMLQNIIGAEAIILGLYKTPITPDGNTTIDTLTPLTEAGGYAPIPLPNDVCLDSLTASKWYLSTDGNGRAAAQYNDVPVSWTFDSANVALAETAYGIYGYTIVLPFDTGSQEIKVGDKLKATSGATGIVTAVFLTAGSWGNGTAAGWLCLKTKTGTFQDSESIFKFGEVSAISVVAGGTGYAVGDIVSITQTGAAGFKGVVSAVTDGVVTAVVIVDGGNGYAAATGLPTTHLSGSGDDGLTLTITTLASSAFAATNTGSAGDAIKKLLFLEAFTAGYLIDTVGQKITYVPKITLSTT